MVDALEQQEADGRYSHFELISCKCVDTYVRVKKNQSQICWKWRKVSGVMSSRRSRSSVVAFVCCCVAACSHYSFVAYCEVIYLVTHTSAQCLHLVIWISYFGGWSLVRLPSLVCLRINFVRGYCSV